MKSFFRFSPFFKLLLLSVATSTLMMPVVGYAQNLSNACPVDGCVVKIKSIALSDGEVKIEFEANFLPSMSKNHLHVWWGENFDIKQVTSDAESEYGMTHGSWHPTDEYPFYTTRKAVSLKSRGEAVTICVTASDRSHIILNPEEKNCKSIANLL
jgi:hypothetical protein